MERELEAIFSHAVALDQAGRMRNTIFCGGRDVYILNYDKTVLLKFSLSSGAKPFDSEICFSANDYDSSRFYEANGRIVFERSGAGFDRKKSCGVPGKTFKEAAALYEQFSMKTSYHSSIELPKEITELLDDNLSHIEVHSEDKKPVIIQRDIYSGTVITITRQAAKGLMLINPDNITEDFGPIGLRTNDLMALFAFNRAVRFCFPQAPGYCLVQGVNSTMSGIIAWCLYDEMGTIQEVANYGRQEPQKRAGKPGANRPSCQTRRKI